jgi:mannose/fructose/N-acetylgalactosamine-specific phosphotransferase system component IIC
MNSQASLRASDVVTTLRGGVAQRTWVSKTAKAAMILFARAGAVVTVVFSWAGRDSADAREALMVPLAVFWTVVSVTLIWTIDGFVRALRGHFNKR